MDDEKLTEATEDDLVQALAFALKFEGRKRVDSASDFMAKITADRLVKHLKNSRFVVMKRPPAPAHSANPRNKHLTD